MAEAGTAVSHSAAAGDRADGGGGCRTVMCHMVTDDWVGLRIIRAPV